MKYRFTEYGLCVEWVGGKEEGGIGYLFMQHLSRCRKTVRLEQSLRQRKDEDVENI